MTYLTQIGTVSGTFMTSEARQSAEAAYKTIQDDLRFADAKALFIVLSVIPWAAAVNVSVDGIASSIHSRTVNVLLTIFLTLVVLAIIFALLVIRPKKPPQRDGSLHVLESIANEYRSHAAERSTYVTKLGQRFETPVGAPGSDYDVSLLDDIGRAANRCSEKYRFVVLACGSGLLSVAVGVAAILCQLWQGRPIP